MSEKGCAFEINMLFCFFLKSKLDWEWMMENSEHSIAREAAGSPPAEAGWGEDILDLVCTLFWMKHNHCQTVEILLGLSH